MKEDLGATIRVDLRFVFRSAPVYSISFIYETATDILFYFICNLKTS